MFLWIVPAKVGGRWRVRAVVPPGERTFELELRQQYQELDGYALDGRAREVLDGLGFSQEMMDGDVSKLSGGWKMRVALARILLMRPAAMLLDEPSNHLDLESLIWLEQFLKGYDGALLMTSHIGRIGSRRLILQAIAPVTAPMKPP